MRKRMMRNAIRASVLMLALYCPASAGIVLSPPGVATPPPPAPAVQGPTTDGEIPNLTTAIVEVVLNLLALP
jgi:hypothetical protein